MPTNHHAAFNHEAELFVKAGQLIGAEVTVTPRSDSALTILIDAGKPGWVEIHYMRDFCSSRVRRTGVAGVLAQADGTGARRVKPRTRQAIANLLATLASRR